MFASTRRRALVPGPCEMESRESCRSLGPVPSTTPRGLWTPGLDGRSQCGNGGDPCPRAWGVKRSQTVLDPKQMHHSIAQSHAKSPGPFFRTYMGSKRGLETASIYEHWAGHESPLPSTASGGVGRPGGAFAILWWDALNERDLALPHLPTQVTRCPIEIRYGNSNPSHDLTAYCVRPTQYRRGRCDAMRMDARPDLGR